MRRIALMTFAGFMAFTLISTGTLKAQTNIYKLHSLFIYNFVKNIKWESVGNDFVIGVYDNSNVHKEFTANFQNKSLSGKAINIVQIGSAAEARNCHIVYMPKANRSKSTALIDELNDHQVLVVTEEDLVDEGASISFELVGSKLNFKINKNNTDQKGLKISSSLLALATVV